MRQMHCKSVNALQSQNIKCAEVHGRSVKYTGEAEMHWTERNCIGEVQCMLEKHEMHWNT